MTEKKDPPRKPRATDALPEAERIEAERFLEEVRLSNLEPLGPSETAAREAAKWFNETPDHTADNNEIKLNTVRAVLTAYSDGVISKREACSILSCDQDELAEAMRATDLPDPPERERYEWTVDQIANFSTGPKLKQ
ncbi:hypothetical protein [Agrobacterium tumefaciens]|uniref:hypothetical protein n=1 Tax=Agrobacterium tumefaciens TaxID=358 RepID=UPI001571EDB8|nr:hypothetical protein [Agrobacterium tumefaciens]